MSGTCWVQVKQHIKWNQNSRTQHESDLHCVIPWVPENKWDEALDKKSEINFRTASDAYLHCAAPRVPTVPQQPPARQFVTIVCEIHFILSPNINGKHSLGSHRVHYVSCWTPTKVTVSKFCFTYRYCSLHFTWRKGCKVVIHLCTEVRGCIHVQLCSLIYINYSRRNFYCSFKQYLPFYERIFKIDWLNAFPQPCSQITKKNQKVKEQKSTTTTKIWQILPLLKCTYYNKGSCCTEACRAVDSEVE